MDEEDGRPGAMATQTGQWDAHMGALPQSLRLPKTAVILSDPERSTLPTAVVLSDPERSTLPTAVILTDPERSTLPTAVILSDPERSEGESKDLHFLRQSQISRAPSCRLFPPGRLGSSRPSRASRTPHHRTTKEKHENVPGK
jgi:hypothetical protein